MKQTIIGFGHPLAAAIGFILIGLSSSSSAQKEYDKNFPKDLNKYILIVERIPLEFLTIELKERDSTALAIESQTIDYIQNLYLVQEPQFPCNLLPRDQVDSVANTNPEKYRYVLKYTVLKKKVDKVKTRVLGFYFHDTQKNNNFKTIEVYHYNTKASLVLIYGLINKSYPKPYKPKYW